MSERTTEELSRYAIWLTVLYLSFGFFSKTFETCHLGVRLIAGWQPISTEAQLSSCWSQHKWADTWRLIDGRFLGFERNVLPAESLSGNISLFVLIGRGLLDKSQNLRRIIIWLLFGAEHVEWGEMFSFLLYSLPLHSGCRQLLRV